ncbi:MAG: class I SAM-dependent methyltransferase, partial [Cytophagaceae bacterium]
MYRFLKNFLRTIIPQRLLFRLEPLLRKIYALRYIGEAHACNICEHTFSDFIPTGKEELLCPYCGSLARNRRLFQLIQPHLKGKMLDFSPSRCLYRALKKTKGIDYLSTDFENEFIADRRYDITHIPEGDESFDLIICYHILEHIENDSKAMTELFRVLKKDGLAFIQTPFKDGEIYEDLTIKDPEQRKLHFRQEDHVRIYSAESLKQRLEKAGFRVEVKTF